MQSLIVLVIGLALTFNFLIGIHGSGNVVSTMIASRAFRPRTALVVGAMAQFLGPFLFGAAVARTVGAELVDAEVVTLKMLLASLMAAIVWQVLTWWMGIPSSSSHGLIGGLLGSVCSGAGFSAILLEGFLKVLIALFAAPFLGFGVGFVMMRLIYFLAAGATPRINEFFRSGQLFTVIGLALSQGANDAQKTIGLIILSLIIGDNLATFMVPFWVVVACAGVMTLGSALGGWRLIRTVGGRFYKVKPVHGFTGQLSAGLVIIGASLLGWPASTAQVVSSAIIGVGSAERMSKIRWGVARDILVVWIFTIPAVALLSAVLFKVIAKLP